MGSSAGNRLSALAAKARGRLVDQPDSVGARARLRRWTMFSDLFGDISSLHVIDLGGTIEAWRRAPVAPASVTVVNLFEPGESDQEHLMPVTGDACRAVESLKRLGLRTEFDLAFSNSLLEHVGGHGPRAALAEQIRTLAPRHWVQTPYRYFPVEPHWLFPGLQFLPMPLRSRVAAAWPLAHSRPEGPAQAMSEVQWTELVGIAELRSYFPDSEVVFERMLGLPKSLIAVKR